MACIGKVTARPSGNADCVSMLGERGDSKNVRRMAVQMVLVAASGFWGAKVFLPGSAEIFAQIQICHQALERPARCAAVPRNLHARPTARRHKRTLRQMRLGTRIALLF